ncbi:uncharacterized protein At4g17910 isoform X1 [Drosophila mojavensis]|uniref:Phosphatidylinositol-glycan biosynthesis class W protein n=2 Tax=Drosophila mojavensis TaxID=7230 RepID=B4KXV7_DROMO|nr:uncharacterized protein At4g17910 isoform X1 [Drosophila mojavensis]XP_032587559.1 uncharacterized protein At4g17910 isoform X1 [Drosophila mojavensis]XP_043865873.1 uncharacterized protein At4g17910 isoform X1 [Drosophila mojavensis]XP_043865874.1 uncharacterized protein At4g17910 isoform X1 [Drosophila mojavensis]EDW17629.1 uncharacterized protein Dmoj_GI12778, isoform A [Drosophila mojavensis]KRG05657.1 uncharacterized protein Dmoj_GI12778, isoform B [Drosophila mojavensis]KRG05658.1 un
MDSGLIGLAEVYDIPEQHTDKRSFKSIEQSLLSQFAILASFSGVVLARAILTPKRTSRLTPTICYLVEFPLVVVPGVLFVTVASDYSAHFVAVMIALLFFYIMRTRAISRIKKQSQFNVGSRPIALTVGRALTHLITSICILAIDFGSFDRRYRKSRLFGARLMDTGIGLFVVVMGLVSRRPRSCIELRRHVLLSAMPLILLGIARVVALLAIDYGQDEHEYGVHLNAFFTLGLTKLFGSIFGYFAHTDWQLLPIAFCVLVCHQVALTFGGISEYVMDDDVLRTTFLSANREGIFSIPGFVALYLLSIYFGRWLFAKTVYSFKEMIGKLRSLLIIVIACWLLMAVSAYAVGISRVTCNLGYVIWMFAIMSTMLWLTMVIFNLIFEEANERKLDEPQSLMDETQFNESENLEKGLLIPSKTVAIKSSGTQCIIIESLNMNGLVYFLLANISTGCVNIFLKPKKRSDAASVLILHIYMFVVTFAVFQLYKRRIRIA